MTWTWNGAISNSCYLSSLHQNLTNALPFLPFNFWHFHPSVTSKRAQKQNLGNAGYDSKWWLVSSPELEFSQVLGFVSISHFWMYPSDAFKPESVQMLMALSQLHSKPRAYCPVLELANSHPTPPQLVSSLSMESESINEPSKEFWNTLQKLLHISNLVSS